MKLKQLTLREKLSQVLMVELEGGRLFDLKDEFVQMFKKINFGMVMISKPLEGCEVKSLSFLQDSYRGRRILLSELQSHSFEKEYHYFDGVKKKEKLKALGIDGLVIPEDLHFPEFMQGLQDEDFFLVRHYTQQAAGISKECSSNKIIALPRVMSYEWYTFSHKQPRSMVGELEFSKKMIEKKIRRYGHFQGIIIETHIERSIMPEFSACQAIIEALMNGVDSVKIPIKVTNENEIERVYKMFNELYMHCLKDVQLESAISRACNRMLMLKQSRVAEKQECAIEACAIMQQQKIEYYN